MEKKETKRCRCSSHTDETFPWPKGRPTVMTKLPDTCRCFSFIGILVLLFNLSTTRGFLFQRHAHGARLPRKRFQDYRTLSSSLNNVESLSLIKNDTEPLQPGKSCISSVVAENNNAKHPNTVDENKEQQHHRIRDLVHHRPEHLGLSRRRNTNPNNKNIGMMIPTTQTTNDNNRKDKAEATLGDIMSSGLVTEPRLPLAHTYGFDNPLDRMVLTANGNLQRLISSYYDSAVSVYVDHCTPRQTEEPPTNRVSNIKNNNIHNKARVWDRVVHLSVLNQTLCTATSVITVRDPLCVTLVESGQVGLGQLFRYLDLLPEFSLIDAGEYSKDDGGGFWREYTLECAEVSCLIHEDFVNGLWELKAKQLDQ